VTNYNKKVFLFVSHEHVEKFHTTRTAMDRFKGRMRTYVNVPVEHFVEGVAECAAGLVATVARFRVRTDAEQDGVVVRMGKDKVAALRVQLKAAHKTSGRLQRDIDQEEAALFAACKHDGPRTDDLCTNCGLSLDQFAVAAKAIAQ
jgi:hypothetical protein